MIINPKDIGNYLGRTKDWREGHTNTTIAKMEAWVNGPGLLPLFSPLEQVFMEHQLGGRSLNSLAREIKISKPQLKSMLSQYNLPVLSQEEGNNRYILQKT